MQGTREKFNSRIKTERQPCSLASGMRVSVSHSLLDLLKVSQVFLC